MNPDQYVWENPSEYILGIMDDFFLDEVDCRDVVNQTVMEVLCQIRDTKDNPVLQLRPPTPDISPVKQFSSSPLG